MSNGQKEEKTYAERIRDFLFSRRIAYAQTFNPESVYAERVLRDLAKFCRATESTFHSDPRIHAALEGRREVFLRIRNHLHLTEDQLAKIYAQKDT